MAKAKNPEILSNVLGIDEKLLAKLGVLNATLAIDSRLFIDPLLLEKSAHDEIRIKANNDFQEYFKKVIGLLRASRRIDDPAWKAAIKLVKFPEVMGTCLGYGAGSIHGSGFGKVLSTRLVHLAKEIIDIGVSNPDLFVAMGLFEPDIGPDRLSDMTTNIILDALLEFNTRIILELGLNHKKIEFILKGKKVKLLANPFELKPVPVILLPTDILRDLPVANDWDEVMQAADENDQLRDDVNKYIGELWESKTLRDKEKLKSQALSSQNSFDVLIRAMNNASDIPYDVNSDPDGLIRWAQIGYQFAEKFPLNFLTQKLSSPDDITKIVREIIEQFQHLIEKCGLNKELYKEDGSPRNEGTSQRLFFTTAYSYCKANNLDISPEIDTGTGKVDFKFSQGFNAKVLVEIKLSRNPKTVVGYSKQLETYKNSQETNNAFYLVIDVGSMGKKQEKLIDIKNEAAKNKYPLSELEFIDGLIKPAPSKQN